MPDRHLCNIWFRRGTAAGVPYYCMSMSLFLKLTLLLYIVLPHQFDYPPHFVARYGCKVDIYAAGVVLYMALLGGQLQWIAWKNWGHGLPWGSDWELNMGNE